MNKIKDIKGFKFNFLTAIDHSYRKNGLTYCLFQCECGKIKHLRIDPVKSGKTKSCGCYSMKRNIGNKYGIKHGMAYSKVYRIWIAMHQRCSNTKGASFHLYGGREIKVCERWLHFENFFKDMGNPPENTSIDRINNDGNYEPSNCRWATPFQQSSNTRKNKFISFNGQTFHLSEWARKTGIHKNTLSYRLLKWPISKALNFT